MNSSPGKRQVQDEAICLARRDFSESSLVLVFLCRATGKLSLLAKGARRPKSTVAVDLLDTGQAGFIANPDGLGVLTSFSSSRWPAQLREDVNKWNLGLYLSEIVNMSTKQFAPAGQVFNLLDESLKRAGRARAKAELAELAVHATARILRWAGYSPQLKRCIGCGRDMGPTSQLFFSPSQGGVLCRDCEPTVFDKFRMHRRGWYYLLGKVNDPISAGRAFEILNLMIREHVGREPRMQAYCRALFTEKEG